MDIIEREIRYRSYLGLSDRLGLGRDRDTIYQMIDIQDAGHLTIPLQDTTPAQLKELTIETYTGYKSEYIASIPGDAYIVDGSDGISRYTLADYIIRLEYELKVVREMGFYAYLLIVQDFINWAKTNGIPVGPGRGSAAGCLISFCIGITDIDPLQFALYFERFLNPARVSMPDIDIDFDDERREKIFEYVRNKYGAANTAKIGTFMVMSAKSAFKDVARAMGIAFDRANRISSLFTELNDDRTVNLQKSFENNEELKTQLELDDNLQKTVEITESLLNTLRQTGVHACGTLITPGNVGQYVPAQIAPNAVYSPDERYVTQYNGKKVEDLGLLKMDFLGLANLSVMRHCIKIIIARHKSENKELPKIFTKYIENSSFYPDIFDQNVYKTIFHEGNTTGIFQFESDGMTKFLIQLKPDRLEDLIAMNALYRPGPIEFIPNFIARKHGTEKIDYGDTELWSVVLKNYSQNDVDEQKEMMREFLDPILAVTYGVAVYQEQLMDISKAVAGFSLAEADNLRRAIGKKIVEQVKKIKAQFVDMAVNINNFKPEVATWIYEKMIEPAALYSFNKSHSAAYSYISFQTAYLKTYYPVEYGAALIRSQEQNTDEMSKFIEEIKGSGIRVLAPDINESFHHVSAIGDNIRLGFVCIKGIGSDIAEYIEQERNKNGKYTSLGNFLLRCQKYINKKSIEGLAKSGALSKRYHPYTILQNIDMILQWTKDAEQNIGGSLFGQAGDIYLKEHRQDDPIYMLKLEYEVFKTFISAHPLDGLYTMIKKKYNMISQFKGVSDYGNFVIIGYVTKIQRAKKKGFFIKIEDITDSLEFFVKDPMDISEFDILYIEGYKGKSNPKFNKIVKCNLSILIDNAKRSGTYEMGDTVFAVRARRRAEQNQDISHISIKQSNIQNDMKQIMNEVELENENDEYISQDSQELLQKANLDQEIDQSDPILDKDGSYVSPNLEQYSEAGNQENCEIKKYILPDDINQINIIKTYIKNNSGTNVVYINNKEFMLDDEAHQYIDSHCIGG